MNRRPELSCLALSLMYLAGCSKSAELGSIYVKSGAIGPAGGSLTVQATDVAGTTAQAQALVGTSIDIPPGALSTITTIQIGLSTTSIVPAGGVANGPVVDFEPSGTVFAVPVTITLPITPPTASSTQLVEVVEASGPSTQLTAIAVASGLATVQTHGFSLFQPFTDTGDGGSMATATMSGSSGSSMGASSGPGATTGTSGTTAGSSSTSGSSSGSGTTSAGAAPNIMLVIDRSGSMEDNAAGVPAACANVNGSYAGRSPDCKWNNLLDALLGPVDTTGQGFLAALSAEFPDPNNPLNLGLTVLPDSSDDPVSTADACSTGKVLIPVGPNNVAAITAALLQASPAGGTPTAATLAILPPAFPTPGANATGANYAILLTDGAPNCDANFVATAANCSGDQCTLGSCPSADWGNPASCACFEGTPQGNALVPQGCLDQNASVQAVATLNSGSAPIKTFVIGFGSVTTAPDATATLNAMGQAGGESLSSGSGYSFYQANSESDLQNALNAIGGMVGADSGGSFYGPGEDPDGGNAYSDGGFPPLACYPLPGYEGNLYGIGAYCGSSDPTCPPGDKCGTAVNASFNFCVSIGVCLPYDGGSSLIQCGPGACCVPYEGENVCAPTGCVLDMLTDGGGCPNP